MAAVVRAWRHFVDHQFAANDKELDGQGADIAEALGNPGGQCSGFGTQFGRGTRRYQRDIENTLAVAVLGGRKALTTAAFVARQDHRNLVVERESLFEHAGLALELLESGHRLLAVGDHGLSLAVVAEAGDFQDSGKRPAAASRRSCSLCTAAKAACGRPWSRRKVFSAMRFWQTLTAAAEGRTTTNLLR
jgi:hypothetical protein